MTNEMKEAGAPATALGAKNGFSLISTEKLMQLYATMLKSRLLDERLIALCGEADFAGSYSSVAGWEASLAGALIDLLPEDTLCVSPRDFVGSFIKGVPLDRIFSRVLFPTGSQENGRSSNVFAPSTVAARLEIATDAARDNKKEKNNRIAVVFLDEICAPDGVLHEALKLAGGQSLPILFVCLVGPDVMSSKAPPCGVPCIPVEGRDVVAVYRVASEAIARARRGSRPTLIDCKSLMDDCPEGRNASGNTPREEASGKASDPILNMENYLTAKGLFDGNLRAEVCAGFHRELDRVTEIAK